jgi:hypothetical protein
MIRYLLAAALALLALGTPARAQQGLWRHEASGIAVPRQIGPMRLRETQDASGGGNYDVILQYGDSDTVVTLYVYRSAYPNPVLWYERTRLAMAESVGSEQVAAAPRSFTLGAAAAPNGLREEFDLPRNSGTMRMRSTAVAIAQIGQWMFKARISSRELDRAGISARMDQVLGAVQIPRTDTAPLPLAVPRLCEDQIPMRGQRLRDVAGASLAAAALQGIGGYIVARGLGGLAAHPDQWCRDTQSGLPARYGSVYRHRGEPGWVVLFGDSGRAAAAGPIDLPGDAHAALYASVPASTQVVALYDGIPDLDSALELALPVVAGQSRGIVEVGSERRGPDAPRKN